MKHLPVLLALVFAAGAPHALAQPDDRAERERIARERAAVDAQFAARKRECNARFAVNDCVAKATRERNAALAPLRTQERLLDDAERRAKAADRLRAQEERRSPERQREEEERRARALEDHKEREERAAEKAARRAATEGGHAGDVAAPRTPGASPGPQGKPREPHAPSGPQVTAEEAAKNRAAYEARLREAEEHRKEVRERIAKRARPAASSLPVPQ